jgi:hypothetical protein
MEAEARLQRVPTRRGDTPRRDYSPSVADSSSPAENKVADERRWVPNVSNGEIVRFAIWCGAVLAGGVAATATLVHAAKAQPPGSESAGWLVHWAAYSGPLVVLVSTLGGFLVFRRATTWQVTATWPWLSGPIFASGYFLALSATGQTDAHSVLCDSTQPCDTSFGLGAVILAVAAGPPLGGLFIAAHALKRLVTR